MIIAEVKERKRVRKVVKKEECSDLPPWKGRAKKSVPLIVSVKDLALRLMPTLNLSPCFSSMS